jgi:hypothetical protein
MARWEDRIDMDEMTRLEDEFERPPREDQFERAPREVTEKPIRLKMRAICSMGTKHRRNTTILLQPPIARWEDGIDLN